MHFQMILLYIILMCFLTTEAIPCDSCGNECTNACGTKHFRTCCFNYLRKRTDPAARELLISNKRLTDFMLFQGRALYTQNDLSQDRDGPTTADPEEPFATEHRNSARERAAFLLRLNAVQK